MGGEIVANGKERKNRAGTAIPYAAKGKYLSFIIPGRKGNVK